LGLGLGDRLPGAKSVWLYREALAQAGKVEAMIHRLLGDVLGRGQAGTVDLFEIIDVIGLYTGVTLGQRVVLGG